MHYLRLGVARSVIFQSIDTTQNNALLHVTYLILRTSLVKFFLVHDIEYCFPCSVGYASLHVSRWEIKRAYVFAQ
jgi:hypothetical protein